eukprot:3586843-Rhodomonas_salina.6
MTVPRIAEAGRAHDWQQQSSESVPGITQSLASASQFRISHKVPWYRTSHRLSLSVPNITERLSYGKHRYVGGEATRDLVVGEVQPALPFSVPDIACTGFLIIGHRAHSLSQDRTLGRMRARERGGPQSEYQTPHGARVG